MAAVAKDHCEISERTAQLYMRLAKGRKEIEARMKSATDVADLTLNEATALLVLSANVEKLLSFFRECEGLSPTEFINRCIAQGMMVFRSPGYDPFAGRSKEEKREWLLFMRFLVKRCGWHAHGASDHVEYVLERPFQNVAEWLGDEGDKFRRGWGQRKWVPHKTKDSWVTFLRRHRAWTLARVTKEVERLMRETPPPVLRIPRRRRVRARDIGV